MMIIKNSFRQLKRTPIKTVLFLLLLIAASAFFSLGGNLWLLNNRNIKLYEDTFTTIGTVEQRETAIRQDNIWDAELKEYRIYSSKEYNKPIPLSVLDFEGANYIADPEWRCYYGAYCPEYENNSDDIFEGVFAVEASPIKDCIPDKPIKLRIKKVLYGEKAYEGADIWFCNHYDPNPEKLYEGKTYVLSFKYGVPHKGLEDLGFEGRPYYLIKSSQVSSKGDSVEDGIAEDYFYEEVTDGFYDTERGKRWLEMAKAKTLWHHIIPVNATHNTNLLMPFYTGDAYIYIGRDISEKEYLDGTKVCLISKDFARNNLLEVGDSVHLPLFYADYENTAGAGYTYIGYNLLNAKGEVYPVFEDNNYIITGIYDISPGATVGEYGIGKNEVIIPKASIKHSDENNILAFIPMMGYNTSFQIPNGYIDEYLSAWKKVGIDELEITFFDKGYSLMEAGINNMKNLSRIFFVAGFILVVLVIIFFCNLFIAKQQKRTAIERSIGFSKRQCIGSLLSGIILLILVGSVIGCTTGAILTNKISKETTNKSYYDYKYGNFPVDAEMENKKDIEYDLSSMIKVSIGMESIVILIGITISLIMISNNVKKEPLELLTTSFKE
ncbi:MAG: FtsX-like permease family protein [Herbinix sp.]|jgi:hypothetical protein|nr:FtsX-like permease family protein [Herbinix sp.]